MKYTNAIEWNILNNKARNSIFSGRLKHQSEIFVGKFPKIAIDLEHSSQLAASLYAIPEILL
jgi:hypothetical protein